MDPATPLLKPPGQAKLDNGRALLFMALAMSVFVAVDAQAKYLTESFHPIQIVWWRQLGLLVGVVVLLCLRGWTILRTDRVGLQILRGALAVCSATLFILAVKYAPLADAVAVSFVAPFVVTVMGALLLGEPVGLRRWSAVTIGFLGTLIIIRPGFGDVHPALALVLVAAVLFATRQVLSRVLGATDRTVTTVAYTALVGSFLITLPLPFVWRWPDDGGQWALLISIAVMAGVAEVFVIKALEIGQAVVVAPVQYTLLIWSVMYGYLLFNQLPDLWTWVGALIIVSTGLYTLSRERVREGFDKS